jgi:hypothetical protein
MTTPAPAPQQTTVVQARPAYGPWHASRILLIVGTVLFVLAAFAAGGHELASIPALPWAFGALAAWMLSGAVPW